MTDNGIFANLKKMFASGYTAREIKTKLLADDPGVRYSALGIIDDISPYTKPSEIDFIDSEIIDILMDNLPREYALRETKKYWSNFPSTLLAIDYILFFFPKDTDHNWDLLLPFLEKSILADQCLIIAVLGASRNIKYTPIIARYLKHDDEEVRLDAEDALKRVNDPTHGISPNADK